MLLLSRRRNLVTNGGFDTDTNWTKNTGWTIAGGEAVATGVAFGDAVFQVLPTTIGRTYEVTFTVSGIVSGSCYATLFGGVFGPYVSANGTYTVRLTRAFATGHAGIAAGPAGFTGNIDNVSVR
jgi:hypothetical protein